MENCLKFHLVSFLPPGTLDNELLAAEKNKKREEKQTGLVSRKIGFPQIKIY
jgi:hypothetical protein